MRWNLGFHRVWLPAGFVAISLVVAVLGFLFAGRVHGPLPTPPVDTSLVALKIGAEQFNAPRNYLDGIYSPVAEDQKVIRMRLYYPDFTAIQGEQRPSIDAQGADHSLTVSILTLSGSPWIPVDTQFENLAREGFPVTKLDPVPNDLLAIYDGISPRNGEWDFLGKIDGTKIIIRCFEYTPSQTAGRCHYDFTFLDLKVRVNFSGVDLVEWQGIYRKTTALLNRLRGDKKNNWGQN